MDTTAQHRLPPWLMGLMTEVPGRPAGQEETGILGSLTVTGLLWPALPSRPSPVNKAAVVSLVKLLILIFWLLQLNPTLTDVPTKADLKFTDGLGVRGRR